MSSPLHTLANRAERHGDRLAVAFTGETGSVSELSYAQLWRRAGGVAGLLRGLRRPGREPQFVLIALPNGLEYITSFYGSLLAGAVAVPFYPPDTRTRRTALAFSERLGQIIRSCDPSLIILPGAQVEAVRDELTAAGVAVPPLVAVEQLPPDDPAPPSIRPRPDDLALLQYTSGSTMEPKGVMVSHGNLAHNAAGFAETLRLAAGEAVTSWLPLYHDMGLIGKVCIPLWSGMSVHLSAPAAFVRRPARWLETISRTRSAYVMAPNFAYDLCARWVTPEQREGLDLSGLRHAIIAAEPVRRTTIEAFATAFGPHGFRRDAMMPAYGLAENTLCVSVYPRPAEPVVREVSAAVLNRDGVATAPTRPDERPASLVGCGTDFAPDVESVIVDPDRCEPCPDGTVGEIWITGPSVAKGYWGLPELSAYTFAAELPNDGRQFLRTGDLGVKLDSMLYIIGRVKDVIIQDGVNHYPQDVEHTAERADPAVQSGGAAVFVVPGRDGQDGGGVVLVCELARHGGSVKPAAVLTSVRRAVAEVHGLQLSAVALVRRGQLPKTTSGKIRRAASAQRWQSNGFTPMAAWPTPVGDLAC